MTSFQARWMLVLAVTATLATVPVGDSPPPALMTALDTIADEDVERHAIFLTSAECAGRRLHRLAPSSTLGSLHSRL